MFYLLFFIFGAIIGSFVNVVVHCLEDEENIFRKKRSQCPSCKHILSWYDLVPLISFVVVKGRCRYCSKKISWRYPIMEIVSGGIFVLVFQVTKENFTIFNDDLRLNIENVWYVLFILLNAELLLITFVYDLKKTLISNSVVLVGVFTTLVMHGFYSFNDIYVSKILWHHESYSLENSVIDRLTFLGLAVLITTVLFWSLHYFSKGKWLGGGDVKLVLWLSLLLGWPLIWFMLLFAFSAGSIVGITLIYLGKKGRKSQLPLGPFLTASTFVIMLYGDRIYDWYLQLFLL